MAKLQTTDALLFNRSGQTYRGTVGLINEFVIEDLTGGGTGLVLDSLGDVEMGGHAGTGSGVVISHDKGNFLMCNDSGDYIEESFQKQADIAIGIYLSNNDVAGTTKLFALEDVVTTDGNDPGDKDYDGMFLMGVTGAQNYKPVDFNSTVTGVINNFFDPTEPGGVQLVQVLNDLTDVAIGTPNTLNTGDVLYNNGGDTFINAPLEDLVVTILQDPDTIIKVDPSNLPIAQRLDGSEVTPTAKVARAGIVSVAKDSQLTLTAEGILDVDIPAIPDVITLKDTFTYTAAGSVNGLTGPFEAGDLFVALRDDKLNQDPDDFVTLGNVYDPSGSNLVVAEGSMVVCVEDGTGLGDAKFVTIGRMNYNPAAPGLQDILDISGEATGVDIVLTSANISTTEGTISTGKGDITTGEGDIKITGAGDLSVGNIDFSRFIDISTI